MLTMFLSWFAQRRRMQPNIMILTSNKFITIKMTGVIATRDIMWNILNSQLVLVFGPRRRQPQQHFDRFLIHSRGIQFICGCCDHSKVHSIPFKCFAWRPIYTTKTPCEWWWQCFTVARTVFSRLFHVLSLSSHSSSFARAFHVRWYTIAFVCCCCSVMLCDIRMFSVCRILFHHTLHIINLPLICW